MDVRFSGEIWYWRGPAPFYFVTVPGPQSQDIKSIARAVTYGWGMIPVRARIQATTWTTSLIPKDGLYVLPMKDMIRKSHNLDEGDTVTVQVTPRPS
jgi:hypothetical protein